MRKFKADNIFDGKEFTGAGFVLVTDERGIVEGVVAADTAGSDVEMFEGILCPGFINAHCHIELSHLKSSIPQHTGLVEFVQQVMKMRDADAEEKQTAMDSAVKELYDSGTVAVGDICNTTDSAALKKDSAIYWHNFIEISGFVDAGAQKRFDLATEILGNFQSLQQIRYTGGENSKSITQSSTLSPHAPYSVSKKLFSLIDEATDGQLISIHNQEASAENELYFDKTGNFLMLYKNFHIDIASFVPTRTSSFKTWLPYFTNNQKILSVHNTFISVDDLSLRPAHYAPLNFCLCPNANLYIENTLPPVDLLMAADCNIVLGTDSYASNTALNIYEEIKCILKNFPAVSLAAVLQWSTLNGAKALGIEHTYGSFEQGKRPGIVLISNDAASRIL